MTPTFSVDQRTRFLGHDRPLDPAGFVAAFAEPIESNAAAAGAAGARLGLAPLTFVVDGAPISFTPTPATMDVAQAVADGVTAAVDIAAFSDFVHDVTSAFGLQFTGRVELTRGDMADFLAWEPVLRHLLDGRPTHAPGSIDLQDRSGAPLALGRSFRIDDDPDEVGAFLAEAGFLHLEGVFTDDEMDEVIADHDRAMAAAEPDDGTSWWARTDEGLHYPCRILGFNHHSPALRALLADERFATIATFTTDEWIQRDPVTSDAAEGLFKRIGVIEGASDVSWHKDCSTGGHSTGCNSLVVGISLTSGGPENGELGVVAGSHRANVPHLGVGDLDLPAVALATRPGDLTIHCSCTLHMSRPPVSSTRRVVYTGFDLAPRADDRITEPSPEEVRRARARLNDHVRGQQRDTPLDPELASHEL